MTHSRCPTPVPAFAPAASAGATWVALDSPLRPLSSGCRSCASPISGESSSRALLQLTLLPLPELCTLWDAAGGAVGVPIPCSAVWPAGLLLDVGEGGPRRSFGGLLSGQAATALGPSLASGSAWELCAEEGKLSLHQKQVSP